MSSQPRSPRIRVDPDGVRIVETARWRRFGWLVGAVLGFPAAFVAVALVIIEMSGPAAVGTAAPGIADESVPQDAPAPAPEDAPGAPAPPEARLDPPPPRAAVAAGAPPPRRRATRGPEPDHAREEPEVDAADAIAVLRDEGETGGIAAFGLPGTDPPRPGIIVPEDFDLPEGFVRHHQATDDGERLPAILTVHPDYDLVDTAGRVVPRPPGGVVPPELAPAGLPIEILEVPGRRTRTTDPND